MKRLIIAVCMLITGIAISIGGYELVGKRGHKCGGKR